MLRSEQRRLPSTWVNPLSMIGDFEIYALTWDDIFLSFEQRYHFLLEKIQSDFEQTAEDDTDERIDRQYLNEKVKRLTER